MSSSGNSLSSSSCCSLYDNNIEVTILELLPAKVNILMNDDQILIYQILEGIKLASQTDHDRRKLIWEKKEELKLKPEHSGKLTKYHYDNIEKK